MVTPASLNGAGCADALPAASADASNKPANKFVFTDASLLSTISPWSAARMGSYQPGRTCESWAGQDFFRPAANGRGRPAALVARVERQRKPGSSLAVIDRPAPDFAGAQSGLRLPRLPIR